VCREIFGFLRGGTPHLCTDEVKFGVEESIVDCLADAWATAKDGRISLYCTTKCH